MTQHVTVYAETRPEPSSCTGRRCSEQRRTSKGETKLVLLRSKRPLKTLCTKGFRPNYQTTQCNELCIVTLYHTYPQRSKPSIFLVNRKPEKTGDSSHTNPPLACNTQQYAAQITLIQNTNMHLGAITGPRSFQPPPHPSWTTPPCPWNPRWCGLACCR